VSIALATGQVVAERYRIVRLLGAGGMGAVYEALDLELDELIALKTFLPTVTQDSNALDRFRREVQIARKVTHPNVCRIFDVGHHGQFPERTAFVTMELLRGETLSAVIRREGPMTPARALPIVRQLADALGAAHRVGVVHRDFKSANVMLAADRAVVTDFGLARMISGETLASLTASGVMVGTPAYMAPEQIEGSDVGPAADIYALGCVMYEMVTGHLPFTGDTPLAIAFKRLTEPAPTPRALVPHLDPRWEAVTLRCLERRPEQRFQRADAVLLALDSSSGSDPTVAFDAPTLIQAAKPPARARRLRSAALALAFVAVAIAAFSTLWLRRERTMTPSGVSPMTAATVPVRKSVAVMLPYNGSGDRDSDWIAVAMQEFLSLALSDEKSLRVSRPEEIAMAAGDLGLAAVDRISTETLRRLGTHLPADRVVLSSYAVSPSGTVTLKLRVQETATGALVSDISAEGASTELDNICLKAAATLRAQWHLPPVDKTIVHADAVFPKQSAVRSYFEALSRLRAFDPAAARSLLSRSLDADPNFPLSHYAMAEASSKLGYDEQARREMRIALDRSTWLPPFERQMIQARYFELSNEWAKAVEQWSDLAKKYPDEIVYAIGVAEAAATMRDGRRALQATAAFRKLAGPLASDPRLDLADARAAEPLGDYALKRTAAGRAVQNAMVRGARYDLARARFFEAMVAHGTGRADAFDAYSAAREYFHALGASDDMGRTIKAMAALEADRGDDAAARRLLDEARAIFEKTGNRRDLAGTLTDIATSMARRGDYGEAARFYRQVLTIQREAGDRAGETITLNNLGDVLQSKGDLAEARETLEQAVAIGREIGDRWSQGSSLGNLALLLFRTGDVARAKKTLDDAIVLQREVSDLEDMPIALAESGNMQIEQGHLREAVAALRDAEDRARKNQQKAVAARALVLLAVAQLEGGDLVSAEKSLGEAQAFAVEAGDRAQQADAHSVEGELLLLRGDRDGALKAFTKALEQRRDDVLGAARTNIALARLALETSDFSKAGRLASAARDVQHARGARLDEVRAEIVLAQALARAGRIHDAKSAVSRANALTGGARELPVANRVALVSALIDALDKDPAAAEEQVTKQVKDAQTSGLLRLSHESIETLAAIRSRGSRTRALDAAVTGIAHDLQTRGFAFAVPLR